MFICESCYRGWFIAVSFGPCEVCGKTAPCDDIPSNGVVRYNGNPQPHHNID